jgi:drug/metabolite transporter (DMT)-like permease
MNNQKRLFEIHLAVLLFGLAGLFGKWLTLSPIIIVLGRVSFASVTLGLFLRFTGQKLKIYPRKNYFYFLLLGLILSVHWVSFFKSIQASTVAVGLLSFSTYPVFTTFLEPLLLKEKISRLNIFFSLFCLTGISLIVPRFDLNNATFVGVLWGIFSGLTFSLLTILNRKLTQHLSSLLLAFCQDFFAALILLPSYFILKPSLSSQDLLLLIVLGVICTAASHTLFIQGMKQVKAQTASIIHFLEPVYGIIFAFLFLREIPSLRTILGGAIILLGQVFIILGFLKDKKSDSHKA